MAEQTFGKAHVEQKIHSRQRRQRKCTTDGARADPVHDRLLRGLTALGFARAEARGAIEQLRRGGGPVPWDAPLEELLRAATQMLT